MGSELHFEAKPRMSLAQKLSESQTLWLSFCATILITIAFQFITRQLGLTLLDGISDPAEVRTVISAMSEYQRNVHIWMTATLDVAYPVAYGALFIGSAYRFFPSKGLLLSLPAIVCVPVDLSEGVVQVLALMGELDLTELKAILTPMKELLFVSSFIITIIGWSKWLIRRVQNQTK